MKKVDQQLVDWALTGMPGADDFCLHIPSYMILDAIQKKNGPFLDLQTVIAFLVGDLISQIKGGKPATPEEVKFTWECLEGFREPEPAANVVDLPVRKK